MPAPAPAARARFIRELEAEVLRHLDELRPDLAQGARARAARIVAAQGALESGYGATRQFRQGFNFGNVSAGSWTGPTIPGGDLEYSVRGEVRRIRQRWRKYSCLAAAVSDFLLVLSWRRYRGARTALLAGDVGLYAKRLRDDDPATAVIEGGYFTAPLAEYLGGLEAALRFAESLPRSTTTP